MLSREKLSRYREVAALLIKYGRRDFIDAATLEFGAIAKSPKAPANEQDPETFVRDLEALGPTFVKLGQMLSTRPDLLSEPFLQALSRLQDKVEPVPFENIQSVIEEELGRPLAELFKTFDVTPIATASLGQVHRAELADGRSVAVKVQRPQVGSQIGLDLSILQDLAGAAERHTEIGAKFGVTALAAEFSRALSEELDYEQEAQNLLVLGSELASFPAIQVPEPETELSSKRVLTMTYIDGTSVGDLRDGHPMTDQEDLDALLVQLCEAYLHQVLTVGLFHCDPHPGNLLLTPDQRLAILDVGMVAQVESEMRLQLLRMLLALSDGRGQELGELVLECSTVDEHTDRQSAIREAGMVVARFAQGTTDKRRLGRTLLEVVGVLGEHHAQPPAALALLGKTLLTLEEVIYELSPTFNPEAVFRRYAETIVRRHLLSQVSPSVAFSKLLETNSLANKVPRRAISILDGLSNGSFRLKVDAIDERSLLGALEKIGNRIALGLVLAALIIGAALVMQVPTEFTLFGYPAIAIILFLAAAVMGFGMVIHILLSDRQR